MSTARDIRILANDASGSLATIAESSFIGQKENSAMTNLILIGAAAALLVAAPAMAKQRVDHYRYGFSHRLPRSVYDAYGFYRGDDSLPSNVSGDFDRRNTFN